MDEICSYPRPSDHVDKSKSTRLLRFRFILGKMSDHSEANQRWENQVEEFRQCNSYRELLGIDGEPENRLSSSGIFSLDYGRSSRRSRKTCMIETVKLKMLIESSSCQCSITSNGQREEIRNMYFKYRKVKKYAKRFSRGHWSFLGPGDEKKW